MKTLTHPHDKKSPSSPMVWITDGKTAMIAFEAAPSHAPRTIPRIHRYYQHSQRSSTMDDGRVFGHGLGPTCALVAKVAPHDLIEITGWCADMRCLRWRYYSIGSELEVTPMGLNCRQLSRADIDTILLSLPPTETEPPALLECDLRLLFSAKQPPWLHTIIDAQLRHWRIHHLEYFFRYTPGPLSSEELWRCTKAAPYWALARWKNQLTAAQLARCVRSSPRGMVSFVSKRIPVGLRKSYLKEFAEDALTHAAESLTDDELSTCASLKPATALRVRGDGSPRRRAVLLAAACRHLVGLNIRAPLPNLKREIIDSIIAFPNVWLAPNQGSFAKVMRTLTNHPALMPTVPEMREMLLKMDSSARDAFVRYIGKAI